MPLRIAYFAWVRERMGIAEEVADVPGDVGTVAELIDWLAVRDGRGGQTFADPVRIRAAIDGMMTGMDASIVGADEIALFPPVTGG